MVGAITYAVIGLRVRPIPFIVGAGALSVTAVVVGFSVAGYGSAAIVMALLLGAYIYATVNAYSATSTILYPATHRGLGYGAMYGAGRFGTIAAPVLAGYALKVMAPEAVYLAVAVPLAVSAVAGVGMLAVTRRRVEDASAALTSA